MFEFYFPEIVYNEPSFWSSILVTLIATFLGFLGAFYLVNIGLRKQKKIEEKKKNKDSSDRLTYFTLLIDNVIIKAYDQALNFESLAKDIHKNPLEKNLLPIIASVDIERLQQMDTVEIFNSYNDLLPNISEKINDYKKIFNSVDFISMRLNQGFVSNEKYLMNLHNHQLFVKENIESLSDELVEEIREHEKNIIDFKNTPDYLFLTKSHSLYFDLTQSEAKLSQIESEFLIPFGRELNQTHKHSKFYFKLHVYLTKSIIRLNHIKTNATIYSSEIFDIRKQMKESIENLGIINEKIKHIIKQE